jgi:hypothetical protein
MRTIEKHDAAKRHIDCLPRRHDQGVERPGRTCVPDGGISHVAASVGTPGVKASCGAEPARSAPLDLARHRVLACIDDLPERRAFKEPAHA